MADELVNAETGEIMTEIAPLQEQPMGVVDPQRFTEFAMAAARAVRPIVMKHCKEIGNRRHIYVEAWQAIANAFGCVASARDVRMVDGGISAVGEVRRMSDGIVIATGEGFVGDDERTWASRPLYARRAMAQTRSISRACRSAFAFVAVMVDPSINPTPAEEMPDEAAGPGANPVGANVNPGSGASSTTTGGAERSRAKPTTTPPVAPQQEEWQQIGERVQAGLVEREKAEKPARITMSNLKQWLGENVTMGMIDKINARKFHDAMYTTDIHDNDRNVILVAINGGKLGKDLNGKIVEWTARLHDIIRQTNDAKKDKDLDASLPRTNARAVRRYPKMGGRY